MNTSFGISLTGLEVSQRRLDVAANNVANVNTPMFKASEVVGVALPQGGVRAEVRPTRDEPRFTANLDGPHAIGSNTDLVREMVSRAVAVTSYRANAGALHREDEMVGSLLNLTA